MEKIFRCQSKVTLINVTPFNINTNSMMQPASMTKKQPIDNQLQRILYELCEIYDTEVFKSGLVVLLHADFIKNENIQRMIEQCAQIIETNSTMMQQQGWEYFNECECGKLFAACFHMTSIHIRDLEFEISDQKTNLYQTYINVFDNLLKITNRLLLLFIGKFSEVFLEKKGLVSVLTFLKIKNFISLLKTSNNTNVLKSLIEHLRIQSRYTDKDQKLWLNFNVFDILLGKFYIYFIRERDNLIFNRGNYILKLAL